MTKPWVDTHCHLQLAREDAEILLQRADLVDWMVVPGIDEESSRAAQELASTYPDRIKYAAGLHPHDASEWGDQRPALLDLMRDAAAVGEIGLDFYRNLAPRDRQIEAFRDQLRIAEELGLPSIVHVRDSFADTYQIIEELGIGPNVILHCWTGGPRWTKRFLDLGPVFSFAGPIAFETGDTVRRGAALVPPDRAMVETDTPFLAPPPHRQEDNEPAHVALVGAALAKVWGMAVNEAAAATSGVAALVFGR